MQEKRIERNDLKMQFPKIIHVIADLNGFGGTEATLLRYLKGSRIPSDCHRVIVLKTIGEANTLGVQMVDAGFSVVALRQTRGLISLRGIMRLHRELKDFKPDVISGWLYQPSLVATLLAPWLKRRPAVVWQIRSLPFANVLKNSGRFVLQRVLAVLSRLTRPTLVSNSGAAMQAHAAIGFESKPGRWTIIPNGIDTTEYFSQREEGLAVRRELGIPEDALLVGCVGRFAPEKGYSVMFEAMALALQNLRPEIAVRLHFLAVGNGVTTENDSFRRLAVTSSLGVERLHLLGRRSDVSRLLRALDVFVLPSISESFPNSLIEAMATGLACTATDVGQCREVLHVPGFIVRPGNVLQLAERIVALAEMDEQSRIVMGNANRQRTASLFGLSRMVAHFDTLFAAVAAAGFGEESKH